jgi:biotin synthase
LEEPGADRRAGKWGLANSIFYGDKLLTAKNPSVEKDQVLLAKLGLSPLAPVLPDREAAMA